MQFFTMSTIDTGKDQLSFSASNSPQDSTGKTAAKLFRSFPDGEIDQDKSDGYDPVFSEERLAIQLLFKASKTAEKFAALSEAEENKIILHGKNIERTPRQVLALCYLKSFFSGDALDGSLSTTCSESIIGSFCRT